MKRGEKVELEKVAGVEYALRKKGQAYVEGNADQATMPCTLASWYIACILLEAHDFPLVDLAACLPPVYAPGQSLFYRPCQNSLLTLFLFLQRGSGRNVSLKYLV